MLASYNLRSCIIVLIALNQKQIVATLHRFSQQKALLLLALEPSPIWSMTCSTSAGSRLVMDATLDTPGAKLHRNDSLVTSRNRNCSDASIAFFRKGAARSGVEPKSNLSSAKSNGAVSQCIQCTWCLVSVLYDHRCRLALQACLSGIQLLDNADASTAFSHVQAATTAV